MTCVMVQMVHFGLGTYPCVWPGGKHQEVTLYFSNITVLGRNPSANAYRFALLLSLVEFFP